MPRERVATARQLCATRVPFNAFFLFCIICLVSHGVAFSPRSLRSSARSRVSTLHESSTVLDDNDEKSAQSHVVFPGGGIFFYWQAGVVSYLREQGYDLDDATMAGASAGALTATLTASNVDFYDATALALDLARRGRSMGSSRRTARCMGAHD